MNYLYNSLCHNVFFNLSDLITNPGLSKQIDSLQNSEKCAKVNLLSNHR